MTLSWLMTWLAGAHAHAPSDPGKGPVPAIVTSWCAADPGTVPGKAAVVPDLRFSDFFRLPIGPRGLEPGERLLSVAGRQVRIAGYMAQAALPVPGRLVLAPWPAELGDEDEHLADDLPPQALFVHLSGDAARSVVPHRPGLVILQGRLDIGARDEPDGHVSTLRLVLDESASRRCLSGLESLADAAGQP